MTGKKLLSAKFSYGLSIALLALPLTFGVSAVRADSPSWGEALIDPIVQALHAVDTRLSSLESSVARFTRSFTSEQIITRELCLADESGERTCITKAQLDIVLANLAPTVAVQPPVSAPSETTNETANEAAAIVIEPTVTVTTEGNAVEGSAPVQDEHAEVETAPAAELPTAIAQAPVLEDEPAHTQAISPTLSGDAIVSHPEVEIFTIPGAPLDDE